MNRNLKKIFSIAVVGCMTLGMLSSCGGSENKSSEKSGSGDSDKKF